ncbi:MAG TPA: hypothetical protein VGH28_23180 [Polyangiaceae bacterium]|jgi:hypothetical protein
MNAVRACLLVLLAACVKTNDISVRTSAVDDRSPTDTGDDYDYEHVAADGYLRQKPGFFAIHGMTDWSEAFARDEAGNVPPLPAAVDLKSKMLFVATSKTPDAKSIEVQKITRTFDGLHIYVLETLPAPSCPAEPRKAPPMDIVALDNVQLDLHVVYDRVHADTCGPPPDAVVTCRVAGSGSPGDAKISASPGEVIDCDSNKSKAQVGAITDRSWQLGGLPPGSASKLAIGKNAIGVTFPVDAWGVYQVDLTIHDAVREGSGLGLVEVLPPEAGVELYYAHAERMDPASLPRAELHVIEMPWGLGTSGDCSLKSPRSFCEVHTAVGAQQGTLNPQENKRYRVMVRYLDARLPGAPNACVRAFAKGIVPVSTCDAADAQRGKGSVWDLGALDVPHAAFYDAHLAKPPAPIAATPDAGAPPPAPTATQAPPPPAPTGSSNIEL